MKWWQRQSTVLFFAAGAVFILHALFYRGPDLEEAAKALSGPLFAVLLAWAGLRALDREKPASTKTRDWNQKHDQR